MKSCQRKPILQQNDFLVSIQVFICKAKVQRTPVYLRRRLGPGDGRRTPDPELSGSNPIYGEISHYLYIPSCCSKTGKEHEVCPQILHKSSECITYGKTYELQKMNRNLRIWLYSQRLLLQNSNNSMLYINWHPNQIYQKLFHTFLKFIQIDIVNCR